MARFDLVGEGWIPCVGASGGVEALGLQETLARAPEIREIFDPSPVVTVALHRLLLAILHRNFGPQSSREWRQMWEQGRWEMRRLEAYFERWRERLDLFHVERPFYQVAGLDYKQPHPISQLTHELASGGNAATLFDHGSNIGLGPARAARYLVAHQAFAVGGTLSREKGEGPSADAAPLTKSAVSVVRGSNLFETLMLNLHRYDGRDEEPFRFDPEEDLPAWERDEETRGEDRWPKGYVDLLTWQSRRIRLLPEEGESGQPVVRKVAIMKGHQFPGGWEGRGTETMVPFKKVLRPRPGGEPYVAVAFQEDRALWRDSLALFQTVEGEHSRPKMLGWLAELVEDGAVAREQTLPLDAYGLSTYQAKVLFWRHERLPLPLAYLHGQELLRSLREALDLAETVGRLLLGGFDEGGVGKQGGARPRPLQILAAGMASASEGRRPDPNAVRQIARHLSPSRRYWAELEAPFRELVEDLAEDRVEEGGAIEYGTRTLPRWARRLRRAAWNAFQEATDGLDSSGRNLKAMARAEREFGIRLHGVLADYLEERGGTV